MDNDNNILKFLQKIKQLESSGGIDTDHAEMQSGIHEGDSAYGSYGLMPNTIQELINRARINGQMDQDYKNIYNEDPEFVKTVLGARPDLEERLAKQLAEKVLDRSQGDEERAAYGWNMGHNRNLKELKSEDLDKSQYIQRFRNLKSIVGR